MILISIRQFRLCDRSVLIDIMAFRYNWNIEVLAQFHATYFYKYDTAEIHWMTEGHHYRVDFVTFSCILGFDEEHRGFSYIHDERRAEVREITFMYLDGKTVDGKVKCMKSFYYILNNLIRHIINPKDGATSDLLASCGKRLEWQWMMQGRGCPMLLT
jgi:hypothetical protein